MKVSKLLLVLSLLGASSASWACSYDGQLNNPFAESYPGSLGIALATQRAISQQQITQTNKLEGQPGLRRASWWLQLFVKRSTQLPNDIHIYLVDSQLWSKYHAGKPLKIHSKPPSSDDAVLMLSESALDNLVSKKITFTQAINMGLIKL
ncbi:hypothetical protein [Photobacterium sanguinicancri]|uniref:Uncharacterized protein n=1 Tax=Photobacterium sanguinicancri TaxID=875932 RepID=A0AAW7Y2I5_9GAMM|nr:hypothetical protein [Photobacterium sanguinicancri]MDO6541513.1 hypothetical protein [Photobacterium sanguinicancri]